MKKAFVCLLFGFGLLLCIQSQWHKVDFPVDDDELTEFVYDKDYNVLYVGTNKSGLYKSHDRGGTWTSANNGLNEEEPNIISISVDSGYLYMISDFNVYYSDDLAESWLLLASPPAVPLGFSIVASGNYVIVGGFFYQGFFRSDDYGNTFIPSNSGIDSTEIGQIWDLCFNGSDVFAVSSESLMASDNYGESWNTVDLGFSTTLISVVSKGSNVVIGAQGTENPGIFLSQDDGNTWNNVNDNQCTGLYQKGDTILASVFGAYNGLSYSLDNGLSWNIMEDFGLPSDSYYKFAIIGDAIFAATYNQGIWKCPISYAMQTSSISVITQKPLQVYPNPADNKLFLNKKMTNENYIVFGIDGTLVMEGTINGNSIDINHLEPGSYLLKFINKSVNEHIKFIKL